MKRNSLVPSQRAWKWAGVICLTLFCSFSGLFAQKTITGIVKDAKTSEPVPGATIMVKGTSVGTISEADGSFEIKVPAGSQELEVSYIGYEGQLVAVTNANVVNILLLENTQQLSEVVITALGIEKEKARVGYAVQDVDGASLIKAREPNPVNSLTGKVAGLTVGSSAELLGGPSVLLRGDKPLYVVDGVPIQSDTWNINPDDIKTITVLKGPNASALYGSRGQYGAIQITTKRGAEGRRGFQVELNNSTMIESSFLTIPKVQYEYGPGDHGRYAFADGKGGGLYDSDYDIWGPKFEGQLIPQYDGEYTPDQEYTTTLANGATYTGNIKPTPWVARGKDNLERFLRPGILQTTNLAVSAGGDNYDIRFSGTYTYQQGIVPNTQLNTGNFNMTAGYNFNKKLRFESAINYNRQFTDNFPDVQYGPNSMIYNIIIWGGADWDIDELKNYWQPGKDGIQQIYAEYTRYNNPWFMANEWLRGHHKTDIYGFTSLTYSFTDNLKLMGRSQVTSYDLFRDEKFPYSATVYGREQAKGDYREDRRNLFENNTDLMLSLDQDLGSRWNINASLGGNLRSFSYNSSYASTDYLNVPGWYNLNNSLNPRSVFNYNADMRVLSAYGFADITYNRYITLSITGRWDKNSTLPVSNNSYFYPSASLSAQISEMVKLPDFITFLKVRGSYAYVGSGLTNSTIGPAYALAGRNLLDYGSSYYTPYEGPSYVNASNYEIGFPYNNQPSAYSPTTIVNPNLKPSTSTAYETGLDLRLFHNRIGFDVTYFNTTDGPKIFNLPLSEATGYGSAVENGITTRKKGLEIVANATIVKGRNFGWNTSVNWSTWRETLDEIYPGVDKLGQFLKVGDRIDAYYAGEFVKTPDGQLINDAGGRPFRNPVNRFLGYTNPDWTWGIYNQLTYKNFGLGFQFDGWVGGVIVNYIQRQTFRGGRNEETVLNNIKDANGQGMGDARYQDYLGNQTWVGQGVVISNGVAPEYDVDGNITNYAEMEFAPNTTPTYLQDWISRYYANEEANLMNRTFAKLREVTLTYTFPAEKFKGNFIQGVSISLVGRNLLYFAEKKNVDVEQFTGTTEPGSVQGYSDLQSPTQRRFGVNLNFTF
ncbi:MAG: SusC/RagA family TonB-linked outer membrane protein [Lewinellaceae bacterium]|nr:SusC/RagA family TonB-linked outer membrane protein [Saprospiraceae bacterium]MCB9340013.1 SusC/RagA family TonB-linked outer membrane protein [Lewinellaceae bacterium]